MISFIKGFVKLLWFFLWGFVVHKMLLDHAFFYYEYNVACSAGLENVFIAQEVGWRFQYIGMLFEKLGIEATREQWDMVVWGLVADFFYLFIAFLFFVWWWICVIRWVREVQRFYKLEKKLGGSRNRRK